MGETFTLTWEPPPTCTAALQALLARTATLARQFFPGAPSPALQALLDACPTSDVPAARAYLEREVTDDPRQPGFYLALPLSLLKDTHRTGRAAEGCTCAAMMWDLFASDTGDRLATVNATRYWTASEDGRPLADIAGDYPLAHDLVQLAGGDHLRAPHELTLTWEGTALAATVHAAGTQPRRRLRLGPVLGSRARLARVLRDTHRGSHPGRLVADLPEAVAELAWVLAVHRLPDPADALAALAAAHAQAPPAQWQALTRLAPTWHGSLADLLATSADVLT